MHKKKNSWFLREISCSSDLYRFAGTCTHRLVMTLILLESLRRSSKRCYEYNGHEGGILWIYICFEIHRNLRVYQSFPELINQALISFYNKICLLTLSRHLIQIHVLQLNMYIHKTGWMFRSSRKRISYIKQVSWLTDHRLPSPSHTMGYAMDYEGSLPEYSDRIA